MSLSLSLSLDIWGSQCNELYLTVVSQCNSTLLLAGGVRRQQLGKA